MHITALFYHYWLHGGTVRSFHLDLPNNSATIELNVEKILRPKPTGPLQKSDLLPCTLRIIFEDLLEVSLSNKLPSMGYYIDISTSELRKSEMGFALNLHDSSSSIYEKDNWVIKSKRVRWEEIERHE